MVVEFSKSRGITPNDLTAIIPVLVDQKSRNVKKVNSPKNPKEETPLITGKSKDYMDNVEFLEDQGFDITYLSVDSEGLVNLKELEESIKDKTILIMGIRNKKG
jgi:cysteine sulfinate desulfinase/cysteine desulfurase-like protein